MRPLRLELEGFGAFRDATGVDFSDIDLVALVGATGSGKSTIIDAITFALYGCVARYDDNKLVAPVISQTSAQARVRLDFELGGHIYSAVRVVRRTAKAATTREARLECGDQVLAADARGVTRAVEALLGLDADQFNRTVVLPQGEFAAFLHDRPESRQATLRELLGLGMYKRISQAARQRAAAARNQIEALQPDVEKAETDLTDEHRGSLTAAIERIGDVRQRFAADVTAIAELAASVDGLTTRVGELDEKLGLLADLHMPDDVIDLDRRLAEARSRCDNAVVALDRARQRRLDTASAVESGPDLAVAREHLRRRRAAAELEREHQNLVTQLSNATTDAKAAGTKADAIASRQQELDTGADQARLLEEQARAAADAGPIAARVASWVKLHERRDASAAALASAQSAEAAAGAALEPLVATASGAVAAEDDARLQLELVEDRVGAAAFAGLLAVGEPCPLCLQEVRELPAHHLDEELQRAKRAVEVASRVRKEVNGRQDQAMERLRAAAADVTAQTKALALLGEELADVASLDVLRAQGMEAERLQAAVSDAVDASRTATAEATAHQSDAENVDAIKKASAARDRVTGLSSRLEDLATRLSAAQAEIVDVPLEAELTAAVAEAERLGEDRRLAGEAFAAAEVERAGAGTALEVVLDECRVAGQQLTVARDRVATLDPPIRTDAGLVSEWQALAVWANERTSVLGDERVAVDADRNRLDQQRGGLDGEARARCLSVLDIDTAGIELPMVGERLLIAETQALGALDEFDKRRDQLADLRQRVDGLRETAVVADKLGHVLRADGFEAWLMASALQGLVEEASVRLRELSSGQFSLVLDERNFAVRDHANADEVRRARTLSGGETFLASLSLALALADATAELSPEGAPHIESIFLDEGFGTLDPQTLDTVATAIEELGASGRMVAIVTHIRELADRMPVRLEVTKSANTSTVVRVEA